ncbi:Hypothetical predicted protein [Olea europaea subsp. europaea]|uniref:Uncharacterized protein n=1 Tax=Olea europaea subsp. europaea TaxID=158383 RepID=A0A8S0RYQ4_OLEEU|nr:Hypothetical predicted protein [Olea europaea subsp. europaea]
MLIRSEINREREREFLDLSHLAGFFASFPSAAIFDWKFSKVCEIDSLFRAWFKTELQSWEVSEFEILETLRHVIIEGAMLHLEKLIVQQCDSLEGVPVGIERLVDIEVLEFLRGQMSLLGTSLQKNLGKITEKSHMFQKYTTDTGEISGKFIH